MAKEKQNVFEFTSGYTLTCRNFKTAGVKFEIADGRDWVGIILPPGQVDKLVRYLTGGGIVEAGDVIIEKPSREYRSKQMIRAHQKITVIHRAESGLKRLYAIIEGETGVTKDQLEGFTEKKNATIVFARAMICFILRYRYGLSSSVIAELIHAKSHATAIQAFKRFDHNGLPRNLYEHGNMLVVYVDAKKRYNKKARPYAKSRDKTMQ